MLERLIFSPTSTLVTFFLAHVFVEDEVLNEVDQFALDLLQVLALDLKQLLDDDV